MWFEEEEEEEGKAKNKARGKTLVIPSQSPSSSKSPSLQPTTSFDDQYPDYRVRKPHWVGDEGCDGGLSMIPVIGEVTSYCWERCS